MNIKSIPQGAVHMREGRPDDEEWWEDVLHDPRARAPKEHDLDGPRIFRLDRQN
ncbi:MAG: hypothetical protein NTZ72_19620 [Afipia sp.]|nr:hypothetical protein [Afipia sp.]